MKVKYKGFVFKINELDNDAFKPEQTREVARLLRDVAKKIEENYDSGKILDINGNTVGEFYFKLELVKK